MEWKDFLASVATKYQLTPDQRATLVIRFDRQNDDKSNIQIANDLHISEVEIKKRLGEIYKIFKPTCPDLTSSSRGKLETLRAWLWQQYEKQENQLSLPKLVGTPHNLPLSGAVKFVGREQAMEMVEEKLQGAMTVAVSSVSGMGGVGKTELVLQYAHQKLAAYLGGVCWVNTRSQDVGVGILKFARTQLGLPQPPENLQSVPEQVQWVLRRWQGEPILLVLDDVTDYNLVKPHLEGMDGRFRVLMTTRLKILSPKQQVELEVLAEGAALDLLRALVEDTARIDRQIEDAKKLCAWLGYLPLGLELVGRYLAKKQDLSLGEMLGRLQAKTLEARALVKQEKDMPEMTAKVGVAAAFELSWAELGAEPKLLCYLLGIFALAPIPWELVKQCLPEKDREDLEDWRDEELLGRSLLERLGEKRYQLHQLIRAFFQAKLEQSQQADDLKRVFSTTLVKISEQLPYRAHRDLIIAFEPNVPHVREVANKFINYLNDEDFCKPSTALVRFYRDQGQYDEGIVWLTKRLNVCEARLGTEHSLTASYYSNLAITYNDLGNYLEAEKLVKKALEIHKYPFYHQNSHDLSNCLDVLSTVYIRLKKLTEAEHYCRQSLKMKKDLMLANGGTFKTSNIAILNQRQLDSTIIFNN